jgi:HK97 gp10 family phage protein
MSMRIEGDERLKRALREFPEAAKRGARRGMKRGMIRVQRAARENVSVDRGRLRGSIAYEVRESRDGIRGVVGSAVRYAPFVEFGTVPHWPPIDALIPWAERHGFPPGRSGAFLVARAIARRGTRAVNFLRDAVKDEQRNVWRDVEREIGRELRSLGR